MIGRALPIWAIVVDGRAADIEAHVRGIDRDEDVLRPGQRVVEPDGLAMKPMILFWPQAGGWFRSVKSRTRRLQPAVR